MTEENNVFDAYFSWRSKRAELLKTIHLSDALLKSKKMYDDMVKKWGEDEVMKAVEKYETVRN